MFIRKTSTRNKSTGESYFTFRLVARERTGKRVRQITLLNPGHQFDLPQNDWPRLCARIDAPTLSQFLSAPRPPIGHEIWGLDLSLLEHFHVE